MPPLGPSQQTLENALSAQGLTFKAHSRGAAWLAYVLPGREAFLRFTPALLPSSRLARADRSKSDYATLRAEARARQELDVLQSLTHPHLDRLLDYPGGLASLGGVSRLTPLCEADLLACSQRHYGREGAPSFAVQEAYRAVLSGVVYMHSQGVAHRRIAPKRVLVESCVGEWWRTVRLCGFAEARRFSTAEWAADMTGTACERRFAAPEMLARASYCEKADVWSAAASFAVLLFPDRAAQRTDGALRAVLLALGRGDSRGAKLLGRPPGDACRALMPSLQSALIECPRRRASAARALDGLQPDVPSEGAGRKRRRTTGAAPSKGVERDGWLQTVAEAVSALPDDFQEADVKDALRRAPAIGGFVCGAVETKRILSWASTFRGACSRFDVPVTGPAAAACLLASDLRSHHSSRVADKVTLQEVNDLAPVPGRQATLTEGRVV